MAGNNNGKDKTKRLCDTSVFYGGYFYLLNDKYSNARKPNHSKQYNYIRAFELDIRNIG